MTSLQWIQVDPTQEPQSHSPAIDQEMWSRYKPFIIAWHAQGFQRPAIRRLLKEDRLDASKRQLETQMKDVWQLGDNRSVERVEPYGEESDEIVDAPSSGLNFSFDDLDDTAELRRFEEAMRQHEQASSYASSQLLLKLQETHSRSAYKIGTVYAIVEPSQGHTYKCNVFIVSEMPSSADHCFAFRVKTWGGRGLRDYQHRPDFDAHNFAVVYAVRGGGNSHATPVEPKMVNEALAIELRNEIDLTTWDPMSRACYTRLERHSFDSSVVLLGELSDFAKAILAIHVRRLNLDTSGG